MSDNKKKADTFERDGEAAEDTARRAWFAPGTVADDKLQQFEEAQHSGGLLDDLTKYAARSVLDKEHRKFEGAKLAGKAVTAPAKATAQVGKTAAKGVGAAARGVGAGARALGRSGQSILDAAARHQAGERGGRQAERTSERAISRSRAGREKAPKKTRGREPER